MINHREEATRAFSTALKVGALAAAIAAQFGEQIVPAVSATPLKSFQQAIWHVSRLAQQRGLAAPSPSCTALPPQVRRSLLFRLVPICSISMKGWLKVARLALPCLQVNCVHTWRTRLRS